MTKTSITLVLPETKPKSIDSVLSSIFWREPDMVPYAKEFLGHIKDWSKTESPYKASDWQKYCQRTGLTQSRYSNILKRLRRSGLVEKTYDRNRKTHILKPSDLFSKNLAGLSEAYDSFINH